MLITIYWNFYVLGAMLGILQVLLVHMVDERTWLREAKCFV